MEYPFRLAIYRLNGGSKALVGYLKTTLRTLIDTNKSTQNLVND